MTRIAVCYRSDTGDQLSGFGFSAIDTASATDIAPWFANVQFQSQQIEPEYSSHKIVDHTTRYLTEDLAQSKSLEESLFSAPTGCLHIAPILDWAKSSAVFASDGPARSTSQAYWTRILVLQYAGEQDGYCLNSASEYHFWRFVSSEPRLRKGNLVLVDNGNLRAVWKDGQGTRLGLQFLDDGMIQFVIFKRRGAGQPPSRVAGRDTFDGVKKQIHVFNLASLIYE
ncbi:MAG: hypothetical protein OXI87_08795 [Albidovulum sp.]|nr:hypothetical protein [Albidovulum sp.]